MFFSARIRCPIRSLLRMQAKTPINYKKHKMHEDTIGKLMTVLHPASKHAGSKVTIVGAGSVGMACAITLLARSIARHICLYDTNVDKMKGEVLDLQHGSLFFPDARIEHALDIKETEGSKMCIISAGVHRKDGESVVNVLQRNTDIFKKIIPGIIQHSPNTILLILTNPIDILSYVAWKLSGLPVYRVFGTGTNLDTARFRVLLSQRLGVSPSYVHGYIIGEHGDNSVAAWSGVSVGGTLLRGINTKLGKTDDPENWGDIHSMVVRSPSIVKKYKGYSNWAIALSAGDLVKGCLGNTLRVRPVSTCVKGLHGIHEEVFLSLPCVMSSDGISRIVIQNLTDTEREKLRNCAKVMKVLQSKLHL